MVDRVLERALLLREGRLHLRQAVATRCGHLGLDARLEALLGLGHELGAHVVPAREVGRRDVDGGVREVADYVCRATKVRVWVRASVVRASAR